MTEMSTSGVRVLGSVSCSTDPPTRLGGPKQRLLLALLVARQGRVVPVGAILDALWGDSPPEDARHTVQVFVSRLRGALRTLGGTVRWADSGYTLVLPDGVVDVRRFEESIAAATHGSVLDHARRELLTEALALWRGRPFGDHADHPSLAPEVARLTEQRLRAVEALADLDLDEGRPQQVVARVTTLAAEHPLAESLHVRLMLALQRTGRRAEALALYERLRRTLSEELGVDPSRPLQQLHLLLLDDDPRLDRLVPADLDAGQLPAGRPSAGRSGTDGASPPHPASVAVLPLQVVGGSRDLAVLASGLHTEMITELSRRDGLTVIGRRSVVGYPPDRPVTLVARELGVATVVEGSLQGAGDRFRLTVGLVDGASGAQTWAVTYDDELTAGSLFSVQRDLAREITERLSVQLSPVTGDRPPDPTTSLDAFQLVAAARIDYDTKTAASLTDAARAYGKATASDPHYVDAWVGLSKTWVATELYGYGDRHVSLPLAEAAVHRALALDPDSPEALTALGALHTAYQEGDQALQALERASRLRPGYADAHSWRCWVQLISGQGGDALTTGAQTVALDPRAAEARAHLALALAATGDPEAGVREARAARRLSPYASAALYEGTCLLEAARPKEAVEVLDPLVGGHQGADLAWTQGGAEAALVLALAASHQPGRAREVLEQIDVREHPFARGLALLALDDAHAASDALSRVEVLGQWAAIVLHQFHGPVWDRAEEHVRPRLLEVARRSWRMP